MMAMLREINQHPPSVTPILSHSPTSMVWMVLRRVVLTDRTGRCMATVCFWSLSARLLASSFLAVWHSVIYLDGVVGSGACMRMRPG